MEKLNKAGQVFFGISIAGFGIQQFTYLGFRPFIIPEWPVWIPGMTFWAYLASAAMIVAGIAIITGWKGRAISLYTGAILLLLFLLFHLPYRLNNAPEILGAWTHELKILAFSGGAFIAAATFKSNSGGTSSFTRFLEKLIPSGRIFFSIMLIVFGIDHFLYVAFVKTLVPEWIPGNVFWTYFAAVALIGSGLAILLRIRTRLVALLLAAMLFLWFVLLHFPRAISFPYVEDKGNEVTSVLQAFGFCGIALMIAALPKHRARTNKVQVL
jgi:uncharacterized membrane protein YphA (DoxX/SURF4 family)